MRGARLMNYFSKQIWTYKIRLLDDALPATCQETTTDADIYRYHQEVEIIQIQLDRSAREITHNTCA